MSKTDEEWLDLLQRDPYSYAPGSQTLESLVQYLIDEIRRLRAENEGLRAEHDELQESIKDLGVDRDLAPYRD